jgi:hypothetical protein
MKRLLLIVLLLLPGMIHAQDVNAHSYEVYLEQNIDASGTDRLTFIDILTGETRSAQVFGERFTPLGNVLLYFDDLNQAVMTIDATGTVSPHPFIQMQDGAQRVDWIVSPDTRLIAWTLTYNDGQNLRTVTSVATPDGMNQREVLVDGPRGDGLRALPVAFTEDNSGLIMDAQPDGIGRFAPYTQYAVLFRVGIDAASQQLPIEERIQLLPDEPGCFCAAGLHAGLFLRLSVTEDQGGFDLRVINLDTGSSTIIPALRVGRYTQAGDVFISPDGRRAIYVLSQIENFGALNQSIESVIVLVNLETMTQTQFTQAINTYVHPVRWTEDDSAILFTSPQRTGTWKISLNTAEFMQVAEASYVGVLVSR